MVCASGEQPDVSDNRCGTRPVRRYTAQHNERLLQAQLVESEVGVVLGLPGRAERACSWTASATPRLTEIPKDVAEAGL